MNQEKQKMTNELRIIVAGSRSFNDFTMMNETLNDIIENYTTNCDTIKSIRIISGNAKGADRLGEEYARLHGYELSIFPAKWDELGKNAGYIRNEQMAQFATEDITSTPVLVAFWDGESKGTKHMIDIANNYDIARFVARFRLK